MKSINNRNNQLSNTSNYFQQQQQQHHHQHQSIMLPSSAGLSTVLSREHQQQHTRELAGSVDSSDTYASCSTHPFASQFDLTQDVYINPLQQQNRGGRSPGSPPFLRAPVKSASGDGITSLRHGVLGSPNAIMDYDLDLEEYDSNNRINRGSRGSLNNTPLPKHRKTRFQQVRIYFGFLVVF
jgi:hypothetical protein